MRSFTRTLGRPLLADSLLGLPRLALAGPEDHSDPKGEWLDSVIDRPREWTLANLFSLFGLAGCCE